MKINSNLVRSLPFGALQARSVIAIVFSYADYKDQVIRLILRLSHNARAYIHNADGLKGFLIEDKILKALSGKQD